MCSKTKTYSKLPIYIKEKEGEIPKKTANFKKTQPFLDIPIKKLKESKMKENIKRNGREVKLNVAN